MSPAARLAALAEGTTTDAALALFDDLPPVGVDAVLGDWAGSEVPTGHRLDGLLTASGWTGKRFAGPEDVHPLVMRDGWSLDPRLVPLGLLLRAAPLLRRPPVAAALRPLLPLARTRRPRARLRAVEHRGVVSAAMVYDALPVVDCFRGVDDDTLLGLMDLRQDPRPYVFVLRRR